MFPTSEQIEAGQVNFKRDGSGTEFSVDPSKLYQKSFEVNEGELNYSEGNEYYFRVTAVFEDGASPISYSSTTNIPLDTPQITSEPLSISDNFNGIIEINWNPIVNANGYKIWIFKDDQEIREYNIGNKTVFSTEDTDFKPTIEEIQNGNYSLRVSAYKEHDITSNLSLAFFPIDENFLNGELDPFVNELDTQENGIESSAVTGDGSQPTFTYKPGDILITPTTEPSVNEKGLAGHSAIVISPTRVLHTSGWSSEPYPKEMSLNDWLNRYKNRNKNKILRLKVV